MEARVLPVLRDAEAGGSRELTSKKVGDTVE